MSNEPVDELNAELDSIQVEDEGAQTEQRASELVAAGQPSEDSIKTAELCGGAWSMVMGLIASRAGDHWALSEAEAQELGNTTGAMLDKYFPNFEGGPEMMFLGAMGVVFLPRYMQHQHIEKQKALKDRESEPEPEKPLKGSEVKIDD